MVLGAVWAISAKFITPGTGDSIFVLLPRTWFFLTIMVVALFVALPIGFKIALSSPDTFGKLLAVGITSWIVFKVLLIGAMVGLIPITNSFAIYQLWRNRDDNESCRNGHMINISSIQKHSMKILLSGGGTMGGSPLLAVLKRFGRSIKSL